MSATYYGLRRPLGILSATIRTKVTLAATTFLRFSPRDRITLGRVVAEMKTVIVVGAGAAGLQATNTLLESDAFLKGQLKVLLLEARDRVGGRACIDKRWTTPLDQGIC